MEAISTSVPSINIPKIHPKTHHFHHLKPSLLLLHHPHISTSTTKGKTPTSISTKPTPPSHHNYTPRHLQPIPSRIQTHRNAATGYAAALIDAALCNNSLDAIHKDVKRLLKWLHHNETLKDMMADPLVEEGVKGRVIKEVSEKARFQRQVTAMVKMLVAKNKSGMVAQVMEEFERIYHELNGGLRVVA
ncbi:hypothetical protein L1987_41889 [Smallanthus sonchifolius]|uniref:Uncharacterized protein n=1 Tax=Smallanthus sonchifolius TaxID=185202 RepID=A0ACB9GVM3_9ASTR|nr:hypothetical protein L1987_41889 [Smallanthus sonchifolius]